jgi:hypothetical protein
MAQSHLSINRPRRCSADEVHLENSAAFERSLRLAEAVDCALGGGSAEARGILIDDRDGRMKGACHRKVTESHHRQIGSSQLLQTGNDTARRGR